MRGLGLLAAMFAAGSWLGWSLSERASANLRSQLAAEQNTRIAAEASRAQLVAELASQSLALETSERLAAQIGAQVAAERSARASVEATVGGTNAQAAPPAAVAPHPVAQQMAVPEPDPIVIPQSGAEAESEALTTAGETSLAAMAALSEGQKYFERGEVDAARRAFERAASLGLPEGALALGTTFDPVSLRKAGIKAAGEPEQALRWYRRAHALAGGSVQP